jgi:hypothetical protein
MKLVENFKEVAVVSPGRGEETLFYFGRINGRSMAPLHL